MRESEERSDEQRSNVTYTSSFTCRVFLIPNAIKPPPLRLALLVIRKPLRPLHPAWLSELPFFNAESYDLLPNSVFITQLRHPVDRIISR